MRPSPFTVRVPDDVLANLHARLDRPGAEGAAECPDPADAQVRKENIVTAIRGAAQSAAATTKS